MKFKLNFKNNLFYRGEIPFYLQSLKSNTVYLCSSKKNVNDYYWVLKDIFQGEVIKPDDSTESDYLSFIYRITEALDRKKKFIVLCSLEFFIKEHIYKGNRIELKTGEKFSLKDLTATLEKNGFEKKYLIENRLEYSIRGDILDFFPVNGDYPIRVEFYDDEIERLTHFHLESQRSVEKLENVDMYMDNNMEEKGNFLELFKEHGVEDSLSYILENREIVDYRLQEILFENPQKREEYMGRFLKNIHGFQEVNIKRFTNEELLRYQDYSEVKEISQNHPVYILSEEEKRYREIFENYPNISYEKYPFFQGFKNGDTLYLTDRELKGVRIRRENKKTIESRRREIAAISSGDYIIHENFGVGKYIGIRLMGEMEYLEIQYAGEDKLLVPMDSVERIEKFQSEAGIEPEVFNLGRKGFRKKREKLQEDILKFAMEIVEIQAKRSLTEGYRFSHDTIMQEEFEDSFPYNLTRDQQKAIEEVKRDMESGKVMDRIVCGDVGCGKTDVAMRAAFKSAMDGKQVALMVPTTILAQQHYERIREYMKNYPVNIELLSRLETDKELRECYKRIASGGVDIVIGTHKILSSQIKFKDLGLVIIDEEQKFGVRAKEKLKTLRANIHMMALTATPIPRTLNLALLGIRDISIIETLPEGRIPIKDFFIEKSDENIREAIMREFSREGQCFYIYNRVKYIEKRAEELKKILPEFIKISYIHGQMPPREIREILHEFENGEIDVLLATTIVENGIDVENANTIIIEGLDKLGLAQMYQLRGRVGRGRERGYCYFIESPGMDPKKKVKQREESMKGLSEMGAGTGFNLSLEDLKIRGAGDVLGEKQHGAIEVLGYGLYMKLLGEEIAKQKGEFTETLPEFKIQLNIPRYIPDEYITGDEKLSIYKRIAASSKLSDLEDMREELEDRFGEMPLPVFSYLRGEKLKILSKKARVIYIEESGGDTLIKFQEEHMNFEKLMDMFLAQKGKQEPGDKKFRFFGTPEGFFREYLD